MRPEWGDLQPIYADGVAEEGTGKPLREFVGFVWQDDMSKRRDVRVWAGDASQAHALVQAEYGEGFRVSVWNEEDAERPR